MVMTLEEVVAMIEGLDEEDVIFSEKPWSINGRAITGRLNSDYRVPTSISSNGLEYFLEASTAREVLEVFGDRTPSITEQCDLLIYYAENDAFPDWVYQGQ
jgi:hypothetical protein